jgi:polyhydroxybutyrate depolymerase
MESGGQIREYRIHVPAAYREDTPAPVVFGFHGNGSSAAAFEEYSGFSSLADQAGFIAVYPQGSGEIPTWEINGVTNNLDVIFLRDLIAKLESECAVDPARLYATGHSRGGGMANRLACDLSDRIAAIGPVSGAYPPEGDCFPARPVAVIAFHGDSDPVIPYNGIGDQKLPPAAYFAIGIPIPQWASAWASRNGCSAEPASILDEAYLTGRAWSGCRDGADVVLYTIPGGGHGWPGADSPFDTARMIWNFFEGHSKPTRSS